MVSSRIVLMMAVPLATSLGVAVGVLGASMVPQSLQITGYSGHLGEWELTATLTKIASTRELSGPLTMKHTGWCGANGPEEKSGEMQLTLARLSNRVDARVVLDGVTCSYSGSLSDTFTGRMVCPDKKPVPLTLWLN